MRVLVSVDMEGVAGVTSPDDIRPGHAEYERNRRYMTDEANAAIRGIATAEPAASIVVSDGHAQFRNLLPDRLDERSTLLRGSPRPLGMMSGVDHDVDAVMFIGYHGRAGTARSVLSHTTSGATVAAIRCNGRELGELGLNIALAAHFDAAPVLATGDDTLAQEAQSVAPGIATVTVKWALGNRAAEAASIRGLCADRSSGNRSPVVPCRADAADLRRRGRPGGRPSAHRDGGPRLPDSRRRAARSTDRRVRRGRPTDGLRPHRGHHRAGWSSLSRDHVRLTARVRDVPAASVELAGTVATT